MKITKYDKFAFLPKRCDECRTLFVFEHYNIFHRPPFLVWDLNRCKRCVKKKEGKEKP